MKQKHIFAFSGMSKNSQRQQNFHMKIRSFWVNKSDDVIWPARHDPLDAIGTVEMSTSLYEATTFSKSIFSLKSSNLDNLKQAISA